MNKSDKVIELLSKSYSPFHAVKNIESELVKASFIKLDEKDNFSLEKGKNYYVKRNDSSIIAFKIPASLDSKTILLTATHTDSPTFKLKPKPEVKVHNLTQINVEPYGSMIISSWLDRPLSIAGRVIVNSNGNLISRLVSFDKDLVYIPNVAIHMNRNVNSGFEFNCAIDTIPLISSSSDFSFEKLLKDELNLKEDEEIVSFDLSLYNRDLPRKVGYEDEFLSSPRLDDLASSYSALLGFIDSVNSKQIAIYASFDNEEVGSLTYQGANSDFLKNIVRRIVSNFCLDKDAFEQYISSSIMLSIDNAHANHPNHPEYSDKTTKVNLNEGIVIKYNAAQHYTSDSISSSLVKIICKKADIKFQEFTNRSDLRGGSTLGNLSNSELSLKCVDIGIPQLAMHSSNEFCGIKDIDDMIKLVETYYSSSISFKNQDISIK